MPEMNCKTCIYNATCTIYKRDLANITDGKCKKLMEGNNGI